MGCVPRGRPARGVRQARLAERMTGVLLGRPPDTAEDVAGYLREQQIILIFDPASGTLHAGTGEAAQIITLKAS